MDLGNGAPQPRRNTTTVPGALSRAGQQHQTAMRRAFKGVMPRGEAGRLFYGALTARLRGRS